MHQKMISGLVFIVFLMAACSGGNQMPIPDQAERGDSFVRPIDSQEMVFVPGGSFVMGLDPEAEVISEGIYDFELSKPAHEVSLSPFWMDKTGITNAQYAQFLTEVGNQVEEGSIWLMTDDKEVKIEASGDGFKAEPGFENYPVIRVTWYGAAAYCDWAGARLPTEAEREYAERGPDGNTYPWGNDPIQHQVPEDNDYLDGIEPVGSYPEYASWVGALDLKGNEWEWVNDWYDPEYYANSPAENPPGPETGDKKIIRGASWGEQQHGFFSVLRTVFDPTYPFKTIRSKVIGFRCVVNHEG